MSDTFADPSDVRDELHGEGLDPTELSDAFIDRRIARRAHPIVEHELAEGNPEWKLPILEALLAGHFILASGADELRQVTSKSHSDGSQASFAGDVDQQGLRGTTLGQQAIEEDDSGYLAERAETVDNPESNGPFWSVTL